MSEILTKDFSDYEYYFAYGSNLSSEFLEMRLRDGEWTTFWQREGTVQGPLPEDLGVYYLEDYEFGYTLSTTPFGVDGVAGNIVPKEGARVYGVVYKISVDKLQRLDKDEDFPEAYSRQTVAVHRAAEFVFANQSAPETIHVQAYVGNPKYVVLDGTPDPEYVKIIKKGAEAHQISPDYIQAFIEQMQPF